MCRTYRKYYRNSTPDRLAPVQHSLGADKQLLLAVGQLPRCYCRAVQADRHGFTSRQACIDLLVGDVDSGLRDRAGDSDGGGLF